LGVFDGNFSTCSNQQLLEAMKPSSTDCVLSELPQEGALVSKAEAGQMDTKQGNASIKSSPNASSIAGANHVLFGRGKFCINNPGNQRMRRIVNKYKGQYFGASRGEKRKLIKAVYDEIVEGGVKFLKQDGSEDEWVEAEGELAIQKVGHLLRDRTGYKDNSQESTGYKDNSQEALKTHKAGPRFQNEISSETTSGFTGPPVGGSPILQQRQQMQQARPVGDEPLRRAIAQQQSLYLGLSVLRNPTSLLIQQLELDRLRMLPLIGRIPTIQPTATSLQTLQAIEQEQELLRIIALRGSIFP